MAELLQISKLFRRRTAWQIQLMLLVALAIEMRWKVRTYKRFLKAQYRFLAVSVAGMTVVRGLVRGAINWFRRKDVSTTDYLDQFVLVHGINALLKLSILLLELSIATLDHRHFILQRIERLAEIECLLKQLALDFHEFAVIAHADKAFRNG